MKNLYGIVGAGGFGREVMPLLASQLKQQLPVSDIKLVFIDQHISSPMINGYPVLTIAEFFDQPAENYFFNVAIANQYDRKKMVELMLAYGATPIQINAANNISPEFNTIGEGAIFCAYTTVTTNATIGKYFHANIYSYVAHDCRIGDYVTFAPKVCCNGNIIIENNVYIGTGVIIKAGHPDNPLVIGEGAFVGMGSVVTKNVLPNQTVVGNPAKLFKHKIRDHSP